MTHWALSLNFKRANYPVKYDLLCPAHWSGMYLYTTDNMDNVSALFYETLYRIFDTCVLTCVCQLIKFFFNSTKRRRTLEDFTYLMITHLKI